ncbi:MAG: protein kinase [Planctomycetota bacterium]
MSVDRSKRVEEIFTAAADRDRSEWPAILDKLCQNDEALRAEVLGLLGFHGDGDDILDSKGAPGKALQTGLGLTGGFETDEPALPLDRMIGRYRVMDRLGAGGMGVVYLAEQERPRRTVALKIIRRGLGTSGLIRRFEHEADILGKLQHIGIAQIYEAGMAEVDMGGGGVRQPFIAMEYIRGKQLREHADLHRLDTRQRLELIAKVCEAVHHAHQRGVIHRDLKPANILVDESGQPKVLDFGVARLQHQAYTEARLTAQGTSVGQIIGTLPYMSPEQVDGNAAEVDVRTDVYALGVVLYQLLTGRFPHDVSSRSVPEAARIIRDEEPTKLGSINRSLRGDIDVITSTALAKDKNRRYQSAREMGDDIARYLAGEPIQARRDSAFYILRRQIRRYKTAAAVAGVVLISLAGFAIFAGYKYRVEQGLANIAAHRAEDLRRGLYSRSIAFAEASYLRNDVGRMRRVLDECPADLRGWEWRYLWKLANANAHSKQVERRSWGSSSICTKTGMVAVSTLLTSQITLWTPAALRGAAEPIVLGPKGKVAQMALSPLGETMLSSESDLTVAYRKVPSGEEIWRKPIASGVAGYIAFSPDGRSIAISDTPKLVRILDASDGHTHALLAGLKGVVSTYTFDHTGTRLVAGDVGGNLAIWNLPAQSTTQEVPALATWLAHDNTTCAAFSPDATRLATSGFDGVVRIWDAAAPVASPTPTPLHTIRSHDNKVFCIAFSPDGKYLASAGTEGVIQIHSPADGSLVQRLFGHSERLQKLVFFPDGRLFSYALEGSVRIWDNVGQPEAPAITTGGLFDSAAVHPGGKLACVVTGNRGEKGQGEARLIDLPTGALRGRIPTPRSIQPVAPTFSRDGRLVAVPAGNLVVLIDAEKGTKLREFQGHTSQVFRAIFNQDHTQLASCSNDLTIRVWNVADATCTATLTPPSKLGQAGLAWSNKGNRLASGDSAGDNAIYIWDLDAGTAQPPQVISNPPEGTGGAYYLNWSPDDSRIIATGENSLITIWSTAPSSSPLLATLAGHSGPIYSTSLSTDGRRMLTGGFDNSARLWDLETQTELLTFRAHKGAVCAVCFSTSGDRVVTVGSGLDSTIRLWDAPPAQAAPVPQDSVPR